MNYSKQIKGSQPGKDKSINEWDCFIKWEKKSAISYADYRTARQSDTTLPDLHVSGGIIHTYIHTYRHVFVYPRYFTYIYMTSIHKYMKTFTCDTL